MSARFRDRVSGLTSTMFAKMNAKDAAQIFVDNAPSIDMVRREKIVDAFPGNQLMRDFYQAYEKDIQENADYPSKLYLDLFRYYAVQNFDDFEIFNSFIMGFGQNYSNYSPENLVHFCDSLKLCGLRQEDIYTTVMQTLGEQDAQSVEK